MENVRFLDKAESLFLFNCKAEDLAHCIEHVLLRAMVTLGVNILNEERVDHSAIDHELLGFSLFFDLLD